VYGDKVSLRHEVDARVGEDLLREGRSARQAPRDGPMPFNKVGDIVGRRVPDKVEPGAAGVRPEDPVRAGGPLLHASILPSRQVMLTRLFKSARPDSA